LAEPATSGLEGYLAEKGKGNVPVLKPGGTWATKVKIGRLNPVEANTMREHIDRTTGRTPNQIT
jgi:hypothetical protein